VFIPFLLLILLIGITPATLFFDGAIGRALAAAAAALAVAAAAILVRPGEGSHLVKLIRPWGLAAAIPALWMVVQLLPMPSMLANPIWATAASALDAPVTGAISIDPGMTVVALGRYLFAIGIIFVATAVAIERRRAELMLLVLAAVATVMAVILLFGEFGAMEFLAKGRAVGDSLHGTSALGIVLCATGLIQTIERIETQRQRTGPEMFKSVVALLVWVAALAVCGFAVLRAAPSQIGFAAACGVGVLALIVAARRLGAGPGVAAGIAGAGLLAALLVSLSSADRHGDATFRYAVSGPATVVERMMADTALTGSGAGTYAALLPIYGTVEEIAADAAPPTAAAATAIELGWPALGLVVLIGLAAAAVLLRGAMMRGRDSFFPAAGASCAVLILLESFLDPSLFGSAMLTLAPATIGLGLAQSASRTVR
jgi:hypothetical protein